MGLLDFATAAGGGVDTYLETQRQMQQAQMQRQMQQLQMQKLQQETAPVDTFLSTAQGVQRAADAGLIDGDKAQAWLLKKLDSTVQTPAQAQYFHNAMGAFTQSGKPTMAGPYADPNQANPPLPQGPAPIQQRMNPRQYDLWSKISAKEPTLAEQMQVAQLKTQGLLDKQALANQGNLAVAGVRGQTTNTLVDERRTAGKNTAVNQIDSGTRQLWPQIMGAEKDLKLLDQPQVRIRDMKEAVMGVTRLMTQQNRMAFGADRAMEFTSYQNEAQDIWDKLANKNEQALVDPGEVAIMRSRIQRIGQGITDQVYNAHEAAIQSRVDVGRFTEDDAAKLRATRDQRFAGLNYMRPTQLRGNSSQSPAGGKPPLPPGIPPDALYSKSTGKYYDARTKQEIPVSQ